MRLHPLSWIATAVVCAALFLGCQPRPRADGLGSPGIIDCGSKAVADHAIDALPGVNRCLSGEGDIVACMLGLLQPAAGIVLDTVLCVSRHEGAAARASAASNPFDERDRRRAQRAAEFAEKMRERGYVTADRP
jgi:hypothetical protein